MNKKYRFFHLRFIFFYLLLSVFLPGQIWADVFVTRNSVPISGVKVYAFKENNAYTGINSTTNENGLAVFNSGNFTQGLYLFRIDYCGYQFWSGLVGQPDTSPVHVVIEEKTIPVAVTTAMGPVGNAKVYLFSQAGAYLGRNATTDLNGQVAFDLPVGKSYKFRADFLGNQYWSDVFQVPEGAVETIAVSCGGGMLQIHVKTDLADLSGIKVYLFSQNSSYLGQFRTSDALGLASFSLSQGIFKIRADYRGYQFWSGDIVVSSNIETELVVPHMDVHVTINKMFQSSKTPAQNIKVYLFSSANQYLGENQTTDENGRVSFHLPEKPYKIRADYLNQEFWSGTVTWQDTEVNIPMADAEITVTGSGMPLNGVNVYVFSSSGSYLSVNGMTDMAGKTLFRLPSGIYKFRADYQNSQYWSDQVTFASDQITPIEISTGGGRLDLTILKNQNEPLPGVKCYVFSKTGSYLGLYDTTTNEGLVSFSLAEGLYKIRMDYLGYQFWTEEYSVSGNMADEIMLPHSDATITVEKMFETPEPMEGVKIYLFKPEGEYLGQNFVTNSSGQVTFSLPDQPYKVRVDYLGRQYWSDMFQNADSTVTLHQGRAEIKTTIEGRSIEDIRVYLFNESGGYLSLYKDTDDTGKSGFILPSGTYQFRADYGGKQYWSPAVNVLPSDTTPVLIELSSAAAVEISATPATIQSGESVALSWTSSNATSCTIEPDIGAVSLNGSIVVSLTQTTIFQITATGSVDTKTASLTVEVTGGTENLPDTIYLGLFDDEQQGGGGLIADSIRILNGNLFQTRTDLSFASPNRLGLTWQAFYNSRSDRAGILGYGWTHSYDAFLEPCEVNGESLIRIMDQTGRAVYFQESDQGVYSGYFNEKSTVKVENNLYVWHRTDSKKYVFDLSGKLHSLQDEAGNILSFGYSSAGLMETVSDMASSRTLTLIYDTQNRLEKIHGPVTTAVPDGIWITYGYDTNSNLASVTYADGSGFSYTYTDSNDTHNLTGVKNRMDHTMGLFGYDDHDRVTSKFTPDTGNLHMEYPSGQVLVTDPYGIVRTYRLTDIEGVRRVSSRQGLSNPPYRDGNISEWKYDSSLNLTEVVYPNGAVTHYRNYDERGNPGTIVSAVGTDLERSVSYVYHPSMNSVMMRTEQSVLDAGTKVTQFDYDNDGNLIPNENPTMLVYRIIEKGNTKDSQLNTIPYEYIRTFGYNPKGQITKADGEKPGIGDEYVYTYDTVTGNPLTVLNPSAAGTITFNAYDAAGRPLAMTDENGQGITYTYDGRGRVLSVVHAGDGASTDFDYNDAGLLESITDPDGIEKRFDYDPVYGRLEQKLDSEGNGVHYTYDTQGDLIEKQYVDASNTLLEWKKWDYANHPSFPGMLWKEITPPNEPGDTESFTAYDYDLSGNISSVTDPNGHTTTHEYDAFARLVTTIQPGEGVTTNQYDSQGNLTSVTDAEEHDTVYMHDDMGRVVSQTSADTGIATYVYDEAGNLSEKADARGVKVNYSYDGLKRLKRIDFPADPDIVYTYDQTTHVDEVDNATLPTFGRGKLTSMNDASGLTRYYYNKRGRLTAKTTKYIHPANQNEFSYKTVASYSPGGRIEHMIYPFRRNETQRRIDYDRPSCMCKIDGVRMTYSTSVTTLLNNITYQPFGGATGLDMGNSSSSTNLYDKSGRIRHSNANTNGEHFYKYDKNGNITGIYTNSIQVQGDIAYENKLFDYDPLGRLSTAMGPFGAISYTYDQVGNRLTETVNGETATYVYVPGTNRIDHITGADPIDFSYDASGNITAKGDMTLTWNDDNRLRHAEKPAKMAVDYVYNGLGQRVWKKTNILSTSPTFLSYNIEHYDFDGKLLAESFNKDIYTKKMVREYIYKGDSPIAMVSSGKLFYFHNDHLNTPLKMTDTANKTVFDFRMEPFGFGSTSTETSQLSNLRFPGQYFDYPTGLHYNYHRYYDPDTGRYMSADPIGLDGGINLYSYVLNDPVNKKDPLGLWYIDINVSGGFIAGGTGGVMINNNGFYPYVGGGLTTPGGGASITWSPSEPTTGWNVGFQGQAGIAGQVGYGFGDGGGWFWEGGIGWPPGASFIGYYVFGPFGGPESKDPCEK